MLTAVTQIDCNGRQVRTYRQSSYYRSISTGSTYKENIGLLQTTINGQNTPGLIRKAASLKSPHPNQRALVQGNGNHRRHHHLHHQHRGDLDDDDQRYHNHSTEIIQNDNSIGSNCSTSEGCAVVSEGRGVSIVLSYDNQRGGVAALKRSSTPDSINTRTTSAPGTSTLGSHKRNGLLASHNMSSPPLALQSLISGPEDSVSSV